MFCIYCTFICTNEKHGIEVWSYFVDENIVWNNQVRTCAYTFILVDIPGYISALFNFFF